VSECLNYDSYTQHCGVGVGVGVVESEGILGEVGVGVVEPEGILGEVGVGVVESEGILGEVGVRVGAGKNAPTPTPSLL
jgi:hypothetical protein